MGIAMPYALPKLPRMPVWLYGGTENPWWQATYVEECGMFESPLRLEIRVARLTTQAFLPTKGYQTDAGFDLAIPENYTLASQASLRIDLAIALQVPHGWYGQILGRSSVFQRGLYVHPGVIDADYRGSLQLLVENRSASSLELQRGDRLAQLLFLPVPEVALQPVTPEALSRTPRGSGGIGSTGH